MLGSRPVTGGSTRATRRSDHLTPRLLGRGTSQENSLLLRLPPSRREDEPPPCEQQGEGEGHPEPGINAGLR